MAFGYASQPDIDRATLRRRSKHCQSSDILQIRTHELVWTWEVGKGIEDARDQTIRNFS